MRYSLCRHHEFVVLSLVFLIFCCLSNTCLNHVGLIYQGMQESPDDQGAHIQASACCKHFVANSMEHTTVAGVTWDREYFDANVTMQDLVDSYLPPFQACVEKGKVSGLMCSYNSLNGVPTCANDWLLKDLARESWGFQGRLCSILFSSVFVLLFRRFLSPELIFE